MLRCVLCYSFLPILVSVCVVMIAVYHEGLCDERRCCSADVEERFKAGGQTDLQNYIDNERLLTLRPDGPINGRQSTAISNFPHVHVDFRSEPTAWKVRYIVKRSLNPRAIPQVGNTHVDCTGIYIRNKI